MRNLAYRLLYCEPPTFTLPHDNYIQVYIPEHTAPIIILSVFPGIPPYVWNSNCHRGDQGAWGNATAFPQSIGIAATFR